MTVAADARVVRIARLRLNVRDLAAVRAFYVEALGFRAEGGSGDDRATLRLGGQEIELTRQRASSDAYPEPRRANDPWFQHFAIAVADMGAAYAHLSGFAHEPISQGGPQTLPPQTGSVTAYKFRDPEGHPLELSHAPGSAWEAAARNEPSALFLGVDHTALAVSDLEASAAFYAGLGFSVGPRSLNHGPEQARLDGLEGAQVDILVLNTSEPGPHIELLHYRTPPPGPPRRQPEQAAAATRTLLQRAGSGPAGELLRDPDGHRLQFID